MVIEWLRYEVDAADHDRFIALDQEIWTTTLARQPGFLGKDVWRDVANPNQLCLIIRWASRGAWHAVPGTLLVEADRAFAAAFGRTLPRPVCTDLDVLASDPVLKDLQHH
jgi:uncharacterized protein (TIGR03792 family)